MRIFSDLHLEFQDYIMSPPKSPDEVLILAGDIAPIRHRRLAPFLERVASMHKYVIYVAGNHEFYHNEFPGSWDDLKVPSNVFKLEQERIVLDGQGYCGCTLWTDLSNPMNELIARNSMWDYKAILNDVTPAVFTAVHRKSIDFLLRYVKPRDVVITHHLPSYQSIGRQYLESSLNPAFATENYELIELLEPSVWYHGHTHTSCSYRIGNTQVICNPRGYYDENPEFRTSGYVV